MNTWTPETEITEDDLTLVEDDGSCSGCFYEDAPYSECPKHPDGSIKCAYWSRGKSGVWRKA